MQIKAANAKLFLFPNFIHSSQQAQVFEHLLTEIDWQQDSLFMHGKTIDIPRLHAWYGDQTLAYGYSGLTLSAKPLFPALMKILNSLNAQCANILNEPCTFNSLLANLYRDQNDAVGWHSDDEPELGKNPIIASVSLGAAREFKMKHKITKEKLIIPLTPGSLLIMAGETQHYWQHAILRSKKVIPARINLTFRYIHTFSS